MNLGPLPNSYYCEMRIVAADTLGGYATESFSALSWQYLEGLFRFKLLNGNTRLVNADKVLWLDIKEVRDEVIAQ